MERIKCYVVFSLVVAVAAFLTTCSDLELKTKVENIVDNYNNSVGSETATTVSQATTSTSTPPSDAPKMVVKVNGITVSAGSTQRDPDTTVGSNSVTNYTILNEGTANLVLSLSPSFVEIGSSGTQAYSVVQPSISVIPAGAFTTFAITFSPPSAATFQSVVTITSNDPGGSPFIFLLSGIGNAPTVSPDFVLKDGTTIIPVGGTIDWPDTIVNTSALKTLTILNSGTAPLVLTGPTYLLPPTGADVGAFQYTQPLQSSISPGQSTTFTITFSPLTADNTYGDCHFTINSNDGKNAGSYNFAVSGQSTQWHGTKSIVTSGSTFYSSPQIAISGSRLYASYLASGPQLKTSTDGGQTWTSVVTGWSNIPTSGSSHSIAASSSNFHIFYVGSGPSLNYAKSTSNGTSPQNVKSYSVSSNYQGIMNSSIFLDGTSVFLAFNDTTNSKLQLGLSSDTSPMGMSFSTYDVTGGTTGQTGGFHPSIKVVSGTTYLSYANGKTVMFARSSTPSNAASWVYRTVYTDATYNIAATSLVTNGTAVKIAFSIANGSATLYSADSTNSGTNWTTASAVGISQYANLSVPLPFVSSGNSYYLAYYKSGTTSIVLAKGTYSGGWESFQTLDNQLGSSGANVSLAVSGTNVFVVYNTPLSHPNQYSVTLKKSIDGGVTW